MLRSLFISLYVVYLLIGLILSISGFSTATEQVAWWSAMLGHAFPIGWFLYTYLFRLVNQSFGSLLVTVSTGVCFLIAFGQYFVIGDVELTPVVLLAISLIGWLIYHSWQVKLNTQVELKVGDAFPIDLINRHPGIKSTDENKLFVFHRGNWCPFCVDQLQGMNDQNQLQDKHKVKLYSIANQSDSKKNLLSRKLAGIEHINDENLELAKSLGILHKNALPFGLQVLGFETNLIKPISVLVSKQNEVIAIHTTKDYRQRPNLEFFLRYLSERSE